MGILDFLKKNKPSLEFQKNLGAGLALANKGRPTTEQELAREDGVNRYIATDPFLFKMLETESGGDGRNPDLVALTLRTDISNLVRCGYVTPETADYMRWIVYRHMLRLESHMSPSSFNLGMIDLYESYSNILNVNLDGAINGQLAKLLKARLEAIEVRAKEINKKEQASAMP